MNCRQNKTLGLCVCVFSLCNSPRAARGDRIILSLVIPHHNTRHVGTNEQPTLFVFKYQCMVGGC